MAFIKNFLAWSLLAWSCVCQEWQDLSPIPRVGTLQEHTTVVLSDTELAIVGGLVEGGATTNNVMLYDIPSDTWRNAAPLPVAMNHPNVVSMDGKIYVLGGLGAAQGWPAVPESFVYDPEADEWVELESMPREMMRGSAVMAVYGGKIYLAGGIPGGRPTLDYVNAYDVDSGEWVEVPKAASRIPAPRDHAGGAVVGSKWYVVGGRDSGIRNTRDTVFVLDFEDLDSGWTTSDAKMPTARGGVSAAAIGTKIYTFGGEGNTEAGRKGVFYQVEVYDTETDEWESLDEMALPRHGTSAAAVGGKIYIPGGGIVQGVGATSSFDAFVP